jgi:hypothetical protein
MADQWGLVRTAEVMSWAMGDILLVYWEYGERRWRYVQYSIDLRSQIIVGMGTVTHLEVIRRHFASSCIANLIPQS